MTYTAYDAAYDADQDAWAEIVQDHLDNLVNPVYHRILDMEEREEPHPWTWERHLLQVFIDEGEDALVEELEEHFQEEAEEDAQEYAYESTPCCNSFYCPCGNTNMDRRF